LTKSRNDMESRNPDGASRGFEVDCPPGMHREFAHPDPRHPSYIGNFLKDKRLPNGKVRKAYSVVESSPDPWRNNANAPGAVTQGRTREDQGTPVDTKVYDGELILLETTKENAALYDEYIEGHNLEMDKMLKKSRQSAGRISVSDGISTGGRGHEPRPHDVAFGD